MNPDNKELQYLASRIAAQKKYPRWWCLDQELKRECLKAANQEVEQWFESERQTEDRVKQEVGW